LKPIIERLLGNDVRSNLQFGCKIEDLILAQFQIF